jgi:uncharacterized protein YjbI with pentapeptide repeats
LAQERIRSLDCTTLNNTNLTDANLQDANLLGANLSTAILVDANLHGARYNARPLAVPSAAGKPVFIPETQWPAHFPLAMAGAVCVGAGCP